MASVIAAASSLGRAALRLGTRLARIKYRLLLINLLVAAVPLVGISFARLHEQQLLAALETDMIHQAELVRAMVLASPGLADRGAILVAAARDTRTRIRILDEHGVVQADSHAGGPPEGAEPAVPLLLGGATPTHRAERPKAVDLVDRSEIRAALAGHYGSATRLWDKQDRVYLFAALPIVRGGHVASVVYVTRSTRDVKVQLYVLRTWLGRLLVATIAITALLTLLLATTIARPLGRLTRRAQRIASRQPAEPDHLAERHDEIGQLARAVAAMTDELERRARDARTLAADISHEFKTPLTGIRGAAELLREGAAEEPDARDRFLAMIIEDADRLDRLVSRLLELARVRRRSRHRAAGRPRALARACAARPWTVPVEVHAEPRRRRRRPQRRARGRDRQPRRQRGATCRRRARPCASRSRVAATSRGSPSRIAACRRRPSARARVWDWFYSTRVGQGGTGLGLAIVRSVALAHGGTVGVDADAGITTFWFEVKVRS